MKFTDIFIRRPVLATVVSLLVLLLGLASIYRLNVRQYPQTDVSVVSVSTTYVGADAELVQGFITTPLERVIASAEGIDYIESTSSAGVSIISAHLVLNYDPIKALTQINSKINQVRNDLPPESEEPVIDIQQADSSIASMYLGFYSEELQGNEITDYLTRVVQPRLSAVQGVQQAEILGGQTFAMRIWLDPDKMAAYELTAAEVRQALAANNFLSAIGQTKSEFIQVSITANTDLQDAEQFRKLVVREQDGTIIRLGDVANVVLGAENYDVDVRFNQKGAIFMGIHVLPTANTLDVIAGVRETLPVIEENLPGSLKLGIPYDSTKYIEDAISEIGSTLTETLAIVIVVIFLFIGSVRAVTIPVVVMPLSLIGAFFLMLVFGFTINLLTLLAIVLSVGLVVDDAIVVLENIERHIRMGKSRFDAAIDGARELVGPIFAMTLTLAAVYVPIGFQGGLTGALFREFAFTLAGAVFVSGILSLTLSPMMCSKILPKEFKSTGLVARLEAGFDKIRGGYGKVLASSLGARPVVITMAVLIVLLAFPFFMFSQKELAPPEDQGVIFGIMEGSPSGTLEQTLLYSPEVAKIYKSAPETESTFTISFPGAGVPGNPMAGFAGLVTLPWSERTRTTQEMVPEIQAKLSGVAGLDVRAVTPSPLPGGSQFPVEFVVTSTATQREIFEVTEALVKRANASGKFMFAFSDLKFDRPQIEVDVDRELAADLGLNMSDIGNNLGSAFGGAYVNRFSIDGWSYKVIPQVERIARLVPEQLGDLYFTAADGSVYPASTIISVSQKVEPRQLKRFQQLNSGMIQGAPMPGTSNDDALNYLQEQAQELFPKGRGFEVNYAGESRQLREEQKSGSYILLFSIIFIFLVLAAQFESFRDPLIILLGSVPLALTGSLLFTFVGFTSINIYSQIGLVTLIGLIAKNGILMVEFANELQRRGKEKLEAIQEASEIRLRPILMTTAATVFGHMPLVFVTGAGAAARNSIGITLVAGMAIGTLFTLFVVPSLYMLIARDRQGQDV
ncbi:efflux RND transporter permease subunit [Puniceicoccus vermicola]|uniref:Efflux RND transporter permease subunit n=1 Tax=Puniceicoccus vermicola TaxID=388746 RepID=A0A7X1AXU8_9BACT|nr:efflux RND transporter permease subunit [Puniceicoccus vermicola]MBC2601904.1 efflux RND transporter permease subunit [Puniceicoccus vermicola]